MRRPHSNPISLLRALVPLILITVVWRALVAQDTGSLRFVSPAFAAGQPIPELYTCLGRDISPPLAWSGLPKGTRSLALVIEDRDHPDPAAAQGGRVHWLLFNIPTHTTGLDEGASAKSLPAGTGQGLNDWHRTGYGGPCPTVGRHRYFHQLYALDTDFPDIGTPNRAELEKAMAGHILGKAQLIGTFERR